MCLGACVCMCGCVCACVPGCAWVCLRACCVPVRVCVCARVLYVCVCARARVCETMCLVCARACMRVCVCVCRCVYVGACLRWEGSPVLARTVPASKHHSIFAPPASKQASLPRSLARSCAARLRPPACSGRGCLRLQLGRPQLDALADNPVRSFVRYTHQREVESFGFPRHCGRRRRRVVVVVVVMVVVVVVGGSWVV